MSSLKNLMKKGVSLIVADSDASPEVATAPPESAPATLSMPEPPPVPASQLPADVADFADVYREAGIALPAHGYGIDKVAEMLENKRLATLGREVKATAVLTALEAAGVGLPDVIQDAVARDHALDAFEASKQRELEKLKSENQARVAAMQQEIESFLRDKNAEIEALKKGSEAASEAFAQLLTRKRREEQRLYDVVCHFVQPAENPITTAAPPPSAPSSPEQA
jgi:hypothetical protein